MTTHQTHLSVAAPTPPLQVPRQPAIANLLSLVIPTYNERQNISPLVQQLNQLLGTGYELIVVDDNSPDGTAAIAQSLTSEFPALRVVHRMSEKGLSSAVIRGWQHARGDILAVMDGDLQHPPEVVLSLLEQMRQGADLAVASRHVEGGGVSQWSFVRRFLSRGAQILGLLALPGVVGRVSDPMSGYFMVRREAIAERLLNPLGYKILIEVLAKGNIHRIAEVGYVFQERKQGESKVTFNHSLEYLRHLLRLRFQGYRGARPGVAFPIGRFVRFCLVGLSGVGVDMALLYLLSDPTTLSLPLTLSKVMAAEVAIANNFLWNDCWTFADLSRRQIGWRPRLKRFLKFNLVCLAGLMMNVLILNLVFPALISNRYLANLVAIAIVTAWNFWVNLKLNWRVTQVK